MGRHAVGAVRNLAIVGHGAAGKTTLVDAVLAKAGAVPRKGSVDDGSSISDFDDEEHKRKFSIDASVLHCNFGEKYLQLLDAPGYPDFVGAALGTLNAVETAVIVVNAAHGVEVNTRRMFREAGQRNLARIIVINKLDAENIEFKTVLDAIKQTFGKNCALLNAPIGVGPAFKGVVSVLAESAPSDCPIDLGKARSDLIDAVSESDDALMEKYLSEGDLTNDEIIAAIPKAIASGSLIPMLCTSGKKDIGVPEFLDAIVKYAPSPAD